MSGTATILVVDDEAHIVQVVSLKLRNAGYEVLTAVDGEEAFEIARRALPDLIITDFQMPYMTGLELCRSLAEHEPTAKIPVLMLTARGYALEESDLGVCNVRSVIAKPFSPRAVLTQVKEILTEGEGNKASRHQGTEQSGERSQASDDPLDASMPHASMPSDSGTGAEGEGSARNTPPKPQSAEQRSPQGPMPDAQGPSSEAA